MRATWAIIAGTGLTLLALGCRTPQPNLKPPPSAEVYNTPPSEGRFDRSVYPKEAFNNRDGLKKFSTEQEVVPVKGPGPGGMPNTGGIH